MLRYANCDAAGTIGSSGGSTKRPMRTRASRTCRSFSRELHAVREILEATAAADAEVPAGRGDARVARVDELRHDSFGEAALHLRDPRADIVSRHAAADEDDESVVTRDAAPAESERIDPELELLSLPNGRGHVTQRSERSR